MVLKWDRFYPQCQKKILGQKASGRYTMAIRSLYISPKLLTGFQICLFYMRQGLYITLRYISLIEVLFIKLKYKMLYNMICILVSNQWAIRFQRFHCHWYSYDSSFRPRFRHDSDRPCSFHFRLYFNDSIFQRCIMNYQHYLQETH